MMIDKFPLVYRPGKIIAFRQCLQASVFRSSIIPHEVQILNVERIVTRE